MSTLLASCSCGWSLSIRSPLRGMLGQAIAGSSVAANVPDMVRHWGAGHRVVAARRFLGVVRAEAARLAWAGVPWSP
jgi:hypothetical protein